MRHLKLFDPLVEGASFEKDVKAALERAMESGQYILGEDVSLFEGEVSRYLGVRHAVGVANGTDALVLSLRAVGVGLGDEVIVPAYTFWATAEAVLTVGAKPIFVDIDSELFGVDVEKLTGAVTEKTRAIIPVHLFGQPANMTAVMAVAREYNLFVIEDNAQAFGAEIFPNGTTDITESSKTGTIGHLGCLSFFPSKILGGVGDGGMVVTNSDLLAATVRQLRSHGFIEKHKPEAVGYNSRLDTIQAAVLRVKLKHIDWLIHERQKIALSYSERLSNIGIWPPVESIWGRHVYNYYVISNLKNRDEIQRALDVAGVATAVYYPYILPDLPVCRAEGDFEVARQKSITSLALPIYPGMVLEDVEYIVGVLSNYVH